MAQSVGSYACDRCETSFEALVPDDAGQDAPSAACPQCHSTEVRRFEPRAAPFPGQPNPEMLHLQHLTPRAPLIPGAMVGMGPYMPLPRPRQDLPPARWAPDPAGRHQWRWWGGSAWTDHVADDGVAAVDPLPPRSP